jgi:hypothetical protein
MENQGLGLALSAKTNIQNVTPKFEGLFGKEFKPIKTPMREGYGYHLEVDDQKTVKTSTYGSELVASRVATKLILEIRYMLWSLGVALVGPALML